MSLDNLEALLVEQLKDIYYAEKQLVVALPKMAKAANSKELKDAFTEHATQTEEHVSRLEQAFEALGVPAKAKKCPAIEGLIEEAAEMMEEKGLPAVLDAGLIASAQRVEHYEIAAYGTARAFAEALGHEEVVTLLEATLDEEDAADELLTEVTQSSVLPAALGMDPASASGKDPDEESEDGEDAESAGASPAPRGKAKQSAKPARSNAQRRAR